METLIQKKPADTALLTAGLDYYKVTMSQLAYHQEPEVDTTFTFHNRGSQRLMDYVYPDELQDRFDELQARGWTAGEIGYLGSLTLSDGQPVFADDYLKHLESSELPPVTVGYNAEQDDLTVTTQGNWSMATFWETVVMGEINEQYFENYLLEHDVDPQGVYDEGNRRLDQKIAVLKQHPEIQIIDFGTRRHFSTKWQEHVVGRLIQECPYNLIGTSNVGLAQKFGIKPIGTFAHETPMVYAGLADARSGSDTATIVASHRQFLDDWYDEYGPDYATALTDTFTSEFFFSDFTPTQAQAWRGVRHDSGDPVAFGEQLITFYEKQNIDPLIKTAVFSDGLDMEQILRLQQQFGGRITLAYGWGTTLTNDMGLKNLNVVMKATHVRDRVTGAEADTVKLSDNPGKHTGPPLKVTQYRSIFGQYYTPGTTGNVSASSSAS